MKFIAGSFDEQSVASKCLWLVLATLTFIVCFYAGTVVMSIVYPLDEALAQLSQLDATIANFRG